MTPAILSLNAGSSSVKFALFSVAADGLPVEICRGQADGLGASPRFRAKTVAGAPLADRTLALGARSFHEAALGEIIAVAQDALEGAEVAAVGHRIVHGGSHFVEPIAIDDRVVAALADLAPLAPLHQTHNLSGVAAARQVFPAALQVACFDTAFHRTHDWVNDTYALPRHLYDEGVRRYGFHGLSYAYVAGELARIDPAAASGRTVIAHLGNGASLCALESCRAVATTMGFSPLDGLAMGTRTGQLDPSVVFYLARARGMTLDAIEDLVYRQSGLKGLSGLSSDMRELEAAGTPEAEQAIAYFVHMIRRELGALTAILGGLDTLVFCGGIGEYGWHIRERVCQNMAWLGLKLDTRRNRQGAPLVSMKSSRVAVRVIPTNEEAYIAAAVSRLLNAAQCDTSSTDLANGAPP